MSTRLRTLHFCVVLSFLAGLMAVQGVTASPLGRSTGPGERTQIERGDYPASVTLGDQQFLFDRLVPTDRNDFERIAEADRLVFYARTAEQPYDSVYGLISGQSSAGMARYLPTNFGTPDVACAAEAASIGNLTAGESTYAFAGIESDIPVEGLEQIADANGQAVYAQPGAVQPSPELFIAGEQGLLRFLITANGSPAVLADGFPFGGQTYAFEGDVTDGIDPGALTKIGCVGPFPALATAADAPVDQVVVQTGDRYLSFTATGAAPDDTLGATGDGGQATPGDSGEIAPADAPTEENTDASGEDSGNIEPVDSEASATAEEPAAEETGAEAKDTETTDQGTEPGLELQASGDLGYGGQPEGLPREVVVGGSRYLFDRVVPVSSEALTQIAANEAMTVFARTDAGPFDALYLVAANGDTSQTARYLPERLEAPETTCLAESGTLGQLDASGTIYAFAGPESDLTPDLLEQIGDSNGQLVYADPGVAQPSPELFVGDANGLMRFQVLREDARPQALGESLAFAGAEFDFVADVTDSVDQATLTKAGCAGPYPVLALTGEAEGTFTNLHVVVNGRILQFSSQGAPADEVTPETATETAVPSETVVDTETAVPETETAVPTDTVVDTETAVPATETALPTETTEPTETPVSTETAVPTETEEAPAAGPSAPSETTVPTEEASPAQAATEEDAAAEPTQAEAVPSETVQVIDPVQVAAEANLPPTVEVQNTTYIFNRVSVDIDITTLVQVQVIEVEGVELTVYARQRVQGAADELYCVSAEGNVVGVYVLVAGTAPPPPTELPKTVQVQNTTYIFNEVEVDIDINVLVQVQVVVIQGIEVTIYSEQDVPGRPTKLYAVSNDGNVVGQYVQASLVVTLQQQTGAATAVPADECPGDPGELTSAGLPGRLPNRIQVNEVAYTFVRAEAAADAGRLTRAGCIGPFQLLTTDAADRSEVLYLRGSESGETAGQVYRFEVALTFEVEIGPSGRPNQVETGDQGEGKYRLSATWLPYIHSSATVILFVADPDATSPDVIYAVDVSTTVVGDAIGEYRLPGENTTVSDELRSAAEVARINPDLTINGQLYVLVAVHLPTGTTSDGFVTLFGSGENPALLLGRDKRRLELFIYEVSEPAQTGG